jgi:HAE1 family hydrophobic/amphiphilic exporter-1
MISDFFIRRPVLANVLAILMVVIGIVALFALPVAQYPDVVPPTVQVTTRYPGASARTVIDAVALPIEQQVNGVEGMIYMQSYSAADGTYTLTVTFKIGVDLNVAQILVQNRVSSALSSLPQAVQAQGVVVQKNSTAILQIVTLTSPDQRYDSLYLANFATIKISPISRPSSSRTRSPGCRASAMSSCSGPASTRCASGSIPTRCGRAGWCRRT